MMIERDDGVKLVVGVVDLASSVGRKERVSAACRATHVAVARQKVVGVLQG